jgi:hypothetical protein
MVPSNVNSPARASPSCRRRSTASMARHHPPQRWRVRNTRPPARLSKTRTSRKLLPNTTNCGYARLPPNARHCTLARPGRDRRRGLSPHSGGTRLVRARCRASRKLSIAGELRQIADVAPKRRHGAYRAPCWRATILRSFNPGVIYGHDSVTSSRYVEAKAGGAMPTIASKTRSSFGTECVQCGNELIAPERSEYRNERHVLHLWSCPKCDRSF